MDKLILVFLFASVDKALTEYIATVFTTMKTFEKRLCSIIIGLLIAFAWNVDAFKLMGFPSAIPFVGVAMTGLLISGGANVIYDAFNPNKETIIKNAETEIKDELEKG